MQRKINGVTRTINYFLLQISTTSVTTEWLSTMTGDFHTTRPVCDRLGSNSRYNRVSPEVSRMDLRTLHVRCFHHFFGLHFQVDELSSKFPLFHLKITVNLTARSFWRSSLDVRFGPFHFLGLKLHFQIIWGHKLRWDTTSQFWLMKMSNKLSYRYFVIFIFRKQFFFLNQVIVLFDNITISIMAFNLQPVAQGHGCRRAQNLFIVIGATSFFSEGWSWGSRLCDVAAAT